jgi:hypothetical protein
MRDTAQLVPDKPGKFKHGPAFRSRAQVVLVRDPFLVERQDIPHHRGGVQQRDGEIVVVSGPQSRERGLAADRSLHTRLELGMRAYAVCHSAQPRTIGYERGRFGRNAFAAPARVLAAGAHRQGRGRRHLLFGDNRSLER